MMMNRRTQNSECSNCNSKQKWVLHNIRHRGDIRKFCTICVLKIHPSLFCPNCFEVYETSNLSFSVPITSTNRIMCLKCPSVVHLDCISKDIVNRYVCPPCLNPSFDFLDSGKSPNNCGSSSRVIDLNRAKVYLAAATISSVSMARAAFTLRGEAEKRVKEVASARKIAKAVLENLNVVEMEEKEKKEKMEVGGSSSFVVAVEEKKEKKQKGSRYTAEKPKGNSAVAAAVAAQKRFQSQVSMALTDGKGKDKSHYVFGSREKETPIQFYSHPPPVQKPLSNGVLGNQLVQKPAATMQEKEKNGLVSFAHGVKQVQGNSSEGEKEDIFQNLMKEFNISRILKKNKLTACKLPASICMALYMQFKELCDL